jgi:hypothetical protein
VTVADPLLGPRGAPRPIPAVGTPEFQRHADEFTIRWPGHGVELHLIGVRERSDGPRAELAVLHEEQEIHWGLLSLASTSARETVVKKLLAIQPELPWRPMLERACRLTVIAQRRGEPLVTLTGRVETPTRELVPGLLYEGEPTMVYADGDTGKSLFALTLAAAVHSGAKLPFGLKPTRPAPAAYLDWETGQETIEVRLGMVAAGLGIDTPAILYKPMTRPLVDEAVTLAAEFARRGIRFVIIDSKMFAVAGGDGAAFHEPITQFYGALRLFAPAAALVLNHVTNADAKGGGPARPFGGAFAFNGPRLIWEAKRDQDVTDATAIAFTCRKANNLPRRPDPFGLRFVPGPATITVYPFDLAEASPRVVAGASLSWRIRLVLANGARTAVEIAEELDASADVVSATLRRLAKDGKAVRVSAGAGAAAQVWGLPG